MKKFLDKIKNLFKRNKLATETSSGETLAVENSTAKPKRKRIRFYERTPENDIKYRGPLSYRYVRLIGWIFQCCFVVSAILATELFAKKLGEGYAPLTTVFSLFGELAVPSFLIANFALILTSNQFSFKKMFRKYLIFLGIIFLLLYGFLYRYVLQIMTKTSSDFNSACQTLTTLLNASPKIGFALNMFVDLLLCLSVWFFLTYKPKKIKGKKIILFRLLVIFPIMYELACNIIKMIPISDKYFQLPFYLFPLMTSKPPFAFVAFILIAFFLKFREKIYEKKCGSLEKYDEFLTTNANSLTFSISTSIIFLIVGVLDIITLSLMTKAYGVAYPEVPIFDIVEKLTKSGIGASSSLILFIPIVMLFSYTKKHKPGVFDTILPIVGIVLVAISILETIIDVLCK